MNRFRISLVAMLGAVGVLALQYADGRWGGAARNRQRFVRLLAVALTGRSSRRLGAQLNCVDVLLAGGAVLILAVALGPTTRAVAAQSPLFDSHVHLWNGEASLRAYEEQLKEGRQEAVGIGAMWFGGPNQALAGRPAQIRAGNDGIIVLATKDPKITPIATVHPYDGSAAVAELERVAAQGIRVLKLHPHTQQFDLIDPRVLTIVRRAGELGVFVLIDNASILPGDNEKLFNLATQGSRHQAYLHAFGRDEFPLLECPQGCADRPRPIWRQHLLRHFGDRCAGRRFASRGRIRLDDAQCRHQPRTTGLGLSAVFA